jgi:hypothetical protein
VGSANGGVGDGIAETVAERVAATAGKRVANFVVASE